MTVEEPKDRSGEFEKALSDRGQQNYVLRLYVVGMTPKSLEAIAAIRRICDEHLKSRYEIEVIDIQQNPERASQAQVVAAPTLIRELPQPLRKFIGRLTDEERILKGLDILPKPS